MELTRILETKTADLPRGEYPRPERVRKDWLCLNGIWQFEIDYGASGRQRGFEKRADFEQWITVPFCPESELSGIGYTDFMPAVWYRKVFTLPEGWAGKRILAHFDAVDYHAFIYVNGKKAGEHRGGFVGFTVEITDLLTEGENSLIVCAEDDVRSGAQPGGKQCPDYASRGCHYTRTTGIWQSVWLEPVSPVYVKNIRYTPDVAAGCLHVEAEASDEGGKSLFLSAGYEGKPMGTATLPFNGRFARGVLPLAEAHLWQAGKGGLYDLSVRLDGGDAFDSYFGLRSVSWDTNCMKLNGKPVFQRLVLDQGFNPWGIWTAPSDDELKADIDRSMAMGFNGARLHQKVFEPRFLFWADVLGYMVWDELGNWGIDYASGPAALYFLPEWLEVIARDVNHPALVGYCPYNETWNRQDPGFGARNLALTWQATRAFDPTRPCIDTSGGFHSGVTNIYDVHDYTQDPAVLAEHYADPEHLYVPFEQFQPGPARDQPYFVSEYGGIRWAPADESGWGYGEAPKTEEEFLARYKALTHILLDNPRICAFCYTQLTDVEQEVNGLYYYNRNPKFDPALIREINQHKAAIEE